MCILVSYYFVKIKETIFDTETVQKKNVKHVFMSNMYA